MPTGKPQLKIDGFGSVSCSFFVTFHGHDLNHYWQENALRATFIFKARVLFSWFVFFLVMVFSAKIENAIMRAMRVWCVPLKNADMSAFWGLLTMAQSLSFFLHLMDWACSSKMPVLCSCVTCIGIHNSSHCQHRIMLRCFARFVVFLNRTKSLSRLFWLQNWHGMTPVVVCVFWEERDEVSSVSWVFCLCWDEMQ